MNAIIDSYEDMPLWGKLLGLLFWFAVVAFLLFAPIGYDFSCQENVSMSHSGQLWTMCDLTLKIGDTWSWYHIKISDTEVRLSQGFEG